MTVRHNQIRKQVAAPSSPHDVLAMGVFIELLTPQRAHSKSKKVLRGLASKKHESIVAVENLGRKLGTDSNGHDLVHVVHQLALQRADCIITIPRGWLHQVAKSQLCVKLAWELIDANKLYLYAGAALSATTASGSSNHSIR